MGFWKFSTFLALSILVLDHPGSLQAATFSLHPDSLSEEEGGLLVDAAMKDDTKRTASEQEQETEDVSTTPQKRSCKVSSCVINELVKRLNQYWGLQNNQSLTDVGPNSYGRRRRDLQP